MVNTIQYTERDWPDDAPLENGAYYCKCGFCGAVFVGYKRRIVCCVCASRTTLAAVSASFERMVAERKPQTALPYGPMHSGVRLAQFAKEINLPVYRPNCTPRKTITALAAQSFINNLR